MLSYTAEILIMHVLLVHTQIDPTPDPVSLQYIPVAP